MVRFLKEVPQLILTPALVLGIAALVLYLLGTVPDYIHPPEYAFREYASIEEAEATLGFKVALPSYFPSYLSWPPAKIYGQREPIPRVQSLFHSRYGSAEVLTICQVASDSEDLPIPLPWVETVLQQTPISIDTSEGFIIAGIGANGRPLNGVYWKSDGFHFIVVTTRSVRELLTIARSI